MCVCVHACVCVCVCVCVCIRMCVHGHVCMCVCVHVYCPSCSNAGSNGRPRADISANDILEWRKLNFSWSKIAGMLGISRSTLYRRLNEVGVSTDDHTQLSDHQLDHVIEGIKRDHPKDGEVLVRGHLLSQGVKVTRQKVRDSIHRVDHKNVAARRRNVIHRRVYSVPYPNYIWHIDSHHKLIRWRFVVHGAVDGFSRLIVHLSCADNNRSHTVMTYFQEAIARFGLPDFVRSDHGGENIAVWQYMISMHNMDYSCVLTGSSVHNERIERMWRDVHRCVVSVFAEIFSALEREELLNPTNEVHLYCLHHVFLPLIKSKLAEFQEGWNSHGLSTEGHHTPFQLFAEGLSEIIDSLNTTVFSEDVNNIDVSDLTNEHVNVPRLLFAPCDDLLHLLDPFKADSVADAKLVYTRSIHTAGHHLLGSCLECTHV